MAAVTRPPRRNIETAIPTTGPGPNPTDLVPKAIGSVSVVSVDGRPGSVCINQTIGDYNQILQLYNDRMSSVLRFKITIVGT